MWDDLPANLMCLAEYADRYGTLQFDEPIYQSLRELDATEISKLNEIGRIMPDEWEAIQVFISSHPITELESSKRIYFLMHYLAIGNDLSILR